MGSRSKAGCRSVAWAFAAYFEDALLERAVWIAAEQADDEDGAGVAIDLPGEVGIERRGWERATAEASKRKTVH